MYNVQRLTEPCQGLVAVLRYQYDGAPGLALTEEDHLVAQHLLPGCGLSAHNAGLPPGHVDGCRVDHRGVHVWDARVWNRGETGYSFVCLTYNVQDML